MIRDALAVVGALALLFLAVVLAGHRRLRLQSEAMEALEEEDVEEWDTDYDNWAEAEGDQ